MRINYKGQDINFKFRIAEITFNEEKERELYDFIEKGVNIKGWGLRQVCEGYAQCNVIDYEEYSRFLHHYKIFKHLFTLVKKYGLP